MSKEKNKISKYEPAFGNWFVEELVDEGNYSSVYKVKNDKNELSSIKYISIPAKNLYNEAMLSVGNKQKKLNSFFMDIVSNIENYTNTLMYINDPYILDFQDHMIVKQPGKNGWDILIKMEYLNSLKKHLENNEFSLRDLLLLGIDMCVAMERFRHKHIMQTNIIENNIFLTQNGSYKLGDFSLNSHISRNLWAKTFITIPFHSAPEVCQLKFKDHNSDIYSLGVLLYKLLNNGRYPFLPKFPKITTEEDVKTATRTRLKGELIPPPVVANSELSKIVLKALSFKHSDRYKTPNDMKKDLDRVLANLSPIDRNKIIFYPSYIVKDDKSSMDFTNDPDRTIAYEEEQIPQKYSLYLNDEFLQEKIYSDSSKMVKVKSHNFKDILNHVTNYFNKVFRYFTKNKTYKN